MGNDPALLLQILIQAGTRVGGENMECGCGYGLIHAPFDSCIEDIFCI